MSGYNRGLHSEFHFDIKVGQSSCQITKQLTCKARLSELSESETATFQRNQWKCRSNILSLYGIRYFIAAFRKKKSAVKQFPAPVKIQPTLISFSRGRYEDFRTFFVWTSEVPMRAACIIDFIFLV
jgi:hypothetical protein